MSKTNFRPGSEAGFSLPVWGLVTAAIVASAARGQPVSTNVEAATGPRDAATAPFAPTIPNPGPVFVQLDEHFSFK